MYSLIVSKLIGSGNTEWVRSQMRKQTQLGRQLNMFLFLCFNTKPCYPNLHVREIFARTVIDCMSKFDKAYKHTALPTAASCDHTHILFYHQIMLNSMDQDGSTS